MKTVSLDPDAFRAVRAQLRATPQARRLHRLHAVLLVAGGLSCRRAASLLGASPRSVEYWVAAFARSGSVGLDERRRTGRLPRLSGAQLAELRSLSAGARATGARGGGVWDGPSARAYIARRWGVALGLRRVQALLASLRAVDREKYAQ